MSAQSSDPHLYENIPMQWHPPGPADEIEAVDHDLKDSRIVIYHPDRETEWVESDAVLDTYDAR